MPAPYSHTDCRLLPYDAEAASVQRCLWAVVTTAQDEPSLAPWLGPSEQHAYGSMPAAAVDRVFKHLHEAHDALAHVVGRRRPSQTGSDPAGGDPPESRKRLQAAILRYNAWQRARRRRTRRMLPSTASNPRRRSDSRRSCEVRPPNSAQPHRASCRRSWRGKQQPLRRTSATCALSWRLTASAPSKISGAATPNGGKPCDGR